MITRLPRDNFTGDCSITEGRATGDQAITDGHFSGEINLTEGSSVILDAVFQVTVQVDKVIEGRNLWSK